MKFINLYIMTILLIGCAPTEKEVIVDQCLRQELFSKCLLSVPSGPSSVSVSNDWDEVIAECGSQSYYLSYRNRAYIKPECTSD